jgi:hypothetical protein
VLPVMKMRAIGDRGLYGSLAHELEAFNVRVKLARRDSSSAVLTMAICEALLASMRRACSDALCLWTAGAHAIGRNATDSRKLVRGAVPSCDTEALHS